MEQFDILHLVYIALFAPLAGALFAGMMGHKQKYLVAGIIPTILVGFSFLASSLVLLTLIDDQNLGFISIDLFTWIAAGNFYSSFGLYINYASASMMVVVTLVSTMVHIYSIGYMKNDSGFNRFFSFLSGFVFSMMLLVMSDNFLGLFAGWEGVGLCSYLLVGFWYDRPKANFASIEAFVTNRIADLALIIGIFMIAYHCNTLNYLRVFYYLDGLESDIIVWIGILLFIGAMGKSAQFPFHTWLANAMEGPTPVSALIHAATMVTAGVYLLITIHPIYKMIPDVGFFIASLGTFVAFFGASMALVNTDLKRIIAYSTLSQLGYMFVAAGLGAYWIALFHLITHAFFKALLFLGAGNVMHAMNDKLDISKMGALHKPLCFTMIMMCIASVALAGIYPFSGFFSKDLILEVAFSEHLVIWAILFVSALFTAFYSFRLLMLVFFVPKNHNEHPHEAYSYMLLSMLPLTILAIIAGMGNVIEDMLKKHLPFDINIPHDTHITLIGVTIAMVCLVCIATILKYRSGGFAPFWKKTFIYRLLSNNYYIPQIYEAILIKPYGKLSYFLSQKIEIGLIDTNIDSLPRMLKALGSCLSKLQNGSLTSMLRLMTGGLFILLLACVAYFVWRQV